ncbi:MAG: terminase small subunit [Romboutsia timonensis]
MLNEKQKQFCNEYIIDFNGTQAAIRSGYSKKTANEQAAQLLAKLSIQTYLKELIEGRNERTKITQDEVVADIIKVKNRCMQNEAILDKDGNETGVYKFDSTGANKALDMLMKHTGGYELDNRQSNGVNITFVENYE